MRIVDKVEKRRVILQAATAAFAENGYARTSVTDIAKRADMATGGIYNYFENKEAVFEAVVGCIYEDLNNGLAGAASGERPIYSVVRYALAFFSERPDAGRLLMMEARNYSIRFPRSTVLPHWLGKLTDMLLERMGPVLHIRPGVDPRFYVSVLLGGVDYLIYLRHLQPGTLAMTDDEIADQIARIIEAGPG